LGNTSPSDDDAMGHSCTDVGSYMHSGQREISDYSNISNASCGYCLSTSESNDTIVCEQPNVICHLSSADGNSTVPVTADDLLNVVSNSQENTFRNSSHESYFPGSITDADAHNIAACSHSSDNCEKSPAFHMGRMRFKAKLRVNVETLTELDLWQKDFAERSKTTMRYANVSLCTGKKTLYKVTTWFCICSVEC